MKALLALLLAGCVGETLPPGHFGAIGCIPPAFTAEQCWREDPGATRCENDDQTAWIFYADGSYANVRDTRPDGTWTAADCNCRVASDGSTWQGW